ncbi:MAG TPA: Crp/Fnr family transcriptional regulator [Bacteroidia bacterium]|nr:Crp/Fnr family transcriptional regulator [Bacteroidia bacterium]
MNQDLYSKVMENLGFMLEEDLVKEIATVGLFRRVKAGQTLMHVGDPFTHMPLVLAGAIKVMREDKDGNELLLYYLESGDTCAMSLSCCMGNKKSKVHTVAEEDSDLVMVPVEYLDRWLSKYQSWKAFIFESIRLRMDEFMETIDSIAFMRMDERLLKYLRDRVRVLGKTEIETTHQQIADDLHTSRVVVSRLIKQLEKLGQVKLGRNHIEVVDL